MPDSSQEQNPVISVILVAGECRSRCQQALDALTHQTIIHQMEIILVDLASASVPNLAFPDNSPIRYIRKSPDVHWQEARIMGVHAAKGDIIAFTEEHAYADHNWAEEILKAHQSGDWAIVGYGFRNANPGSYFSRGGLLADYGRFLLPLQSGMRSNTSGHNAAYKRIHLEEAIRSFGTMPFPDFLLQQYFQNKKIPIYVSAEAVLSHENFEELYGFLACNFYFCHIMAKNRAQVNQWSLARRLLYFASTPFVAPPLKLLRLAASLKNRPKLWLEFIQTSPVVLITYIISAMGESLGYIHYLPDAESKFTKWEVHTPRTSEKI